MAKVRVIPAGRDGSNQPGLGAAGGLCLWRAEGTLVVAGLWRAEGTLVVAGLWRAEGTLVVTLR